VRGFILDENLPRLLRLPTQLEQLHASDIAASAKDSVLWQYARLNRWVIVTKDADFSNRIVLDKAPPWIIHFRFGNIKLQAFKAKVNADWQKIEDLLPRYKLIRVHTDRLEAID
jgi:predicted nuclease of predicted toxin-antitoxin system